MLLCASTVHSFLLLCSSPAYELTRCAGTGLYCLRRADYEMFRNFTSWLTLCWEPETSHSGSIYIVEIGTCCQPGLLHPLLNICQHAIEYTIVYLSIILQEMGLWFVSSFSLWNSLTCVLVTIHSHFWKAYPSGGKLLGHRVCICSDSINDVKYCSKVFVPIYTELQQLWEVPFLRSLLLLASVTFKFLPK